MVLKGSNYTAFMMGQEIASFMSENGEPGIILPYGGNPEKSEPLSPQTGRLFNECLKDLAYSEIRDKFQLIYGEARESQKKHLSEKDIKNMFQGYFASRPKKINPPEFNSITHAEEFVRNTSRGEVKTFLRYHSKWCEYKYLVNWDAKPQKREDVIRERYGVLNNESSNEKKEGNSLKSLLKNMFR